MEAELNTRYLDRSDVCRGLLLAVLSSNHIELLGAPGTAKSALTYDFMDYLIDDAGSDKKFSWLFTKFTTVDEVMGPVSIQGMKDDRYTRIVTNKLPEARFAYLDEIYKANSPLLNSLLSILQEGIFYNNGGATHCPLQMCIGSSNELPDEDEGLSALRDRYLLRYQVQYLQDATTFSQLLTLDHPVKVVSKLSMVDLDADIEAVKALKITDDTVRSITLVWERLREMGIFPSDRRFKAMIKVMAAESWLMGATEIVPDSIIVGEHILWDKPEQFRTVKQIIRASVNPSLSEAQEFLTAAQEGLATVKDGSNSEEITQVAKSIRVMLQECEHLSQSTEVTKITASIKIIENQVVNMMLGSS